MNSPYLVADCYVQIGKYFTEGHVKPARQPDLLLKKMRAAKVEENARKRAEEEKRRRELAEKQARELKERQEAEYRMKKSAVRESFLRKVLTFAVELHPLLHSFLPVVFHS